MAANAGGYHSVMRTARNPWIPCLLAAAGLLLTAPAAVADVYRWTDDNGQVHFSQRPPPQGAQRIELPQGGPGASAPDRDAAQRRDRQQRLLDAYEYEREQEQARQARAEDEQRKADARCQELQRRWRRLSFPGPVYVSRADGGRDYLNDEQRAAQKVQMRPAYVQACGREP